MRSLGTVTTSSMLVKCFIVLLGITISHSAGNTEVRNRVYRRVSSDMKYLLDGMWNHLKYVTQSLETVRMMCNVQSRKGMVAFSARASKDLVSAVASVTVVFDTIVTNIGKAYNGDTGIFTALSDGVYVFALTVATYPKKWFDSEIVVNGTPKLYCAANSQGGGSFESNGCTSVLELKTGNRVWIRKVGSQGNRLNGYWSSFSGWKLL